MLLWQCSFWCPARFPLINIFVFKSSISLSLSSIWFLWISLMMKAQKPQMSQKYFTSWTVSMRIWGNHAHFVSDNYFPVKWGVIVLDEIYCRDGSYCHDTMQIGNSHINQTTSQGPLSFHQVTVNLTLDEATTLILREKFNIDGYAYFKLRGSTTCKVMWLSKWLKFELVEEYRVTP